MEWFFQFAPNNHYRSFFLHTLPSTIVFKLDYVVFYKFYTEDTTFPIKKCSVRHPSSTHWHHVRGRLTPPCVRQKYPERVKIVENLVWCARKCFLSPSPLPVYRPVTTLKGFLCHNRLANIPPPHPPTPDHETHLPNSPIYWLPLSALMHWTPSMSV